MLNKTILFIFRYNDLFWCNTFLRTFFRENTDISHLPNVFILYKTIIFCV